MRSLILVLWFALFLGSAGSSTIEIRPVLKTPSDLGQFELDGSGKWNIEDGKLVLVQVGRPSGPIRRPAALAILKSQPFSEVVLEADLRSTAKPDVPRRDIDLVIAYQGPARFYYVHLSATTDNVHNGIFLVDNADRKRIDDGTAKPRLTDQSWHHVRVTWDSATGRIDVYFDNSTTPILSATDHDITSGQTGLGSFDDTGEFRNILVKGLKAVPG